MWHHLNKVHSTWYLIKQYIILYIDRLLLYVNEDFFLFSFEHWKKVNKNCCTKHLIKSLNIYKLLFLRFVIIDIRLLWKDHNQLHELEKFYASSEFPWERRRREISNSQVETSNRATQKIECLWRIFLLREIFLWSGQIMNNVNREGDQNSIVI